MEVDLQVAQYAPCVVHQSQIYIFDRVTVPLHILLIALHLVHILWSLNPPSTVLLHLFPLHHLYPSITMTLAICLILSPTPDLLPAETPLQLQILLLVLVMET